MSETWPDGSIIVRSLEPLGPHPRSVIHDFRQHSEQHPDRPLLIELDGNRRVELSWGEARRQADSLAQSLLDRGLASRSLLVLSRNSRLHLLALLAGMTVGAPVVPTSVAYSLRSVSHTRLREVAQLVDPALVVAEDSSYNAAVSAVASGRLVLSREGDVPGSLSLVEMTRKAPSVDVELRCAALEYADTAKIMFSSGSTGAPKGVITTHGMLSANQQQMRQIWPFLHEDPPVVLDWLPWSHTFGGSHNLNMILSNGGTLWVDDGGPGPALIERTVRNLNLARPTIYFNVPAGYSSLLPQLERDPAAARAFFDRLRVVFYAAAALPQQSWDRIVKLAEEYGSEVRITTSWGLTETSPAATSAHFPILRSDCIGVPLPGLELRLVPMTEKSEVRVRGVTVTPGYYSDSTSTAQAFDEDGFFRTGDAVAMVNQDDPHQGLVFRGRIAEDFKLATGTFVHVGALRPRLVSASSNLISDAVICGHDGDRVTAMAWLSPGHANRCDSDGVPEEGLRRELTATLRRLAAEGRGSSQRVERVLVLLEPPQLDSGELTDKGYINQRVVRERRADLVALLAADPLAPQVVALDLSGESMIEPEADH